MIPENCLECMGRQANMNPMMGAGYQQPMQMPFGAQPYSQMPFGMQPMGQSPYGMQPMGQMPYMGQQDIQMPFDTGTQQFQQGMGGQMFPGMQPSMGMQPGMMQAEGGPDFEVEPGPPVATNINYTQGYLRTKIGSRVKIEFLIGTNMLIDREGTLLDVGISYVVIREVETDDQLLCDIYSIKFIRFYF